MKKIQISLIVTILLYNWPELNTSGGLGFIRNNLAWVFMAGLTGWGLLKSMSRGIVSLPTRSWWLILGYTVAVFPFLVNITEYFSYGQLLPIALLGCILLFVALFQLKPLEGNKDKVLLVIIIVAIAETLIGSWQLFHSLMMQLTSHVEQFKLVAIDGTFNQRNVFASFISTGLIASVYLLISDNPLVDKKVYKRLLFGFLLAGSFILILTQSRVGIYSFIAGTLLLVFTHLSYKQKVIKLLLPVSLGLVLALTFSSYMFQGQTKDFSKTHNRQLIYNTSLEAISEAPIAGHGLGSFERVYLETLAKRIHDSNLTKQGATRPENLSHPHNELLYWGIQGGLVSVIGLLLLVAGVIAMTCRAGLKHNVIYYSLFTPTALHLMVELPFYISAANLIMALFLLFYVVSSLGEVRDYSFRLSPLSVKVSRGVIGILSLGVIGCLLLNSYSLNQAVKFEAALNRTEEQLQKSVVTLGWSDAYQSLLLKHRANIAVRRGETEPVVNFLDWLERQNSITPRLQYFLNIYYSYQILGQQQNADEVRRQIEYYYSGVKSAEEWLNQN